MRSGIADLHIRWNLSTADCYNLDKEKRTVHCSTVGGDYRSGRPARWRFEIRDEQGK